MNIHMTYFGIDSIREMFTLFYDKAVFDEFYDLFKHLLIDGLVSPASLQNLFLHFDRPGI